MQEIKIKTRLFVEQNFKNEPFLTLNQEQSHYLKNVLRCQKGDNLQVFNGIDGEWFAEVEELGKKSCLLAMKKQIRKMEKLKKVSLFFAPIKKNHTDFIIAKATELGVTDIYPITTQYSETHRVNIERFRAISIEAAELSERLCVPEIYLLQPLEEILSQTSHHGPFLFCDESKDGQSILSFLKSDKFNSDTGISVLIGPEGGFSKLEREKLQQQENCHAIRLGNRVMRADTAALYALSCINAAVDFGEN